MLRKLPVIGKDYEIQILRNGTIVSVIEPENVTERVIEKVIDRNPVTGGGRIKRRSIIQGYEIACEGAKVSPLLASLISDIDGLNLKGEFLDPSEISVRVTCKMPNTQLIEDRTYSECTITDPETSVGDLEGAIIERLKITAVYKKQTISNGISAMGDATFNRM